MKQILADITPMGSNNLFVTHYWPDKQTDPPLHYHEDYIPVGGIKIAHI